MVIRDDRGVIVSLYLRLSDGSGFGKTRYLTNAYLNNPYATVTQYYVIADLNLLKT